MNRQARQLSASLVLLAFGWILGLLGGCGQATQKPLAPALQHLRHWVPYRSPGGLFFLHRFELREVDVQAVLPGWGKTHVSSTPDLPAVGLDQGQAWTVARSYLARLPSLQEWRYAVGGDIGFRFPWGNRQANPSYANTLELGLRRRTRVGTFESGRDPAGQGCYDLIGNVAEWTSTPLAMHPLDLHGSSVGYSIQKDALRLEEGALPLSPFLAGVVPWMPELLSPDNRAGLRFFTVGFSYAESLRNRETPILTSGLMVDRYWDDQGARPFGARESSSFLGLRLATDPYTFLARLESMTGPVTSGDLQVLERFLHSFKMDFERVARLRVGLHRESLGMDAPGELALAAWRFLGVQR